MVIHTTKFRGAELRYLVIEGQSWFLASDVIKIIGGTTKIYPLIPASFQRRIGTMQGAGPGANRRLFTARAVKLAAKMCGFKDYDELATWLDDHKTPEPDLRAQLLELRNQLDRIISCLPLSF